MDHVKGPLGSLLPKLVELLNLVNCKLQISVNKEVKCLEKELKSLKSKLAESPEKGEVRPLKIKLAESPEKEEARSMKSELAESPKKKDVRSLKSKLTESPEIDEAMSLKTKLAVSRENEEAMAETLEKKEVRPLKTELAVSPEKEEAMSLKTELAESLEEKQVRSLNTELVVSTEKEETMSVKTKLAGSGNKVEAMFLKTELAESLEQKDQVSSVKTKLAVSPEKEEGRSVKSELAESLKKEEVLSMQSKLAESLRKKQEMESLNRELESIYDYFLRESKDCSNLDVKLWADFRETSYDVEEVIDTFLVCVEDSTPSLDILKELVQKIINLLPMDYKARTTATKDKIKDAVPMPASTTAIDPSIQALYTDSTEPVGIDKKMDDLIKLMFQDQLESDELLHSETFSKASTDKVLSSEGPLRASYDKVHLCEVSSRTSDLLGVSSDTSDEKVVPPKIYWKPCDAVLPEVTVGPSDDKEFPSEAPLETSDDKVLPTEVPSETSDDMVLPTDAFNTSNDKVQLSLVSSKKFVHNVPLSEPLLETGGEKILSSEVPFKSSDDKVLQSTVSLRASDEVFSGVTSETSSDNVFQSKIPLESANSVLLQVAPVPFDDKFFPSKVPLETSNDKVISSEVLPETSDDKRPSSEVASESSNLVMPDYTSGPSDKVQLSKVAPGLSDDFEPEGENRPSKKKPKTVVVVGFGGLGKTTLVRVLYDKIKKDFNCCAFISVGRNADEKEILITMLHALSEDGYNITILRTLDMSQLINLVLCFLEKRRYLVVIDDLWDEGLWRFIECAFGNDRHRGSQLIITTRKPVVADACCFFNDGLIYQMQPLSNQDSHSLFYRRIFPEEVGRCPPDFEQVSGEILRKCGGVPLAIITIASLLASNGKGIKPIQDWYVLLDAIGHGLAESANLSVVNMNKILSLSYYDLPSYLKNCLLYLSAFPEDYEIKKDRLVWRWIAEGFVQRTNGESSLFQVGEDYFNMLVNRSMIQPVYKYNEVTVNSCRVHDLILDLLCSWSSEANFFTVFDGTERNTSNSATKIRRLSVKISMGEVCTQLCTTTSSLAHVRSLTLYGSGIISHHSAIIPAHMPCLSNTQFLRVLDFEECNLEDSSHPLYVQNLLHLTYLGMNRTNMAGWNNLKAYVRMMEEEIGNLKFLLILDIRMSGVNKLPASVVELRKLICLRVDRTTVLPEKFGDLACLEELTEVLVSHDFDYMAEQLGRLTKLRVLDVLTTILDDTLDEKFIDSLNKLVEIRTLSYSHNINEGIIDPSLLEKDSNLMEDSFEPSKHLGRFQSIGSQFSTLPSWIDNSSQISSLTISVNEVKLENIETLGEMQNLCYLSLSQIKGVKELAPLDTKFEDDLFPVARVVKFHFLMLLPYMFPKGAMPKVQHLEFQLLPTEFTTGKYINLDIRHLPSLQEVVVWLGGYPESCKDGVEETKAALRAAADAHSNGPTLSIVEDPQREFIQSDIADEVLAGDLQLSDIDDDWHPFPFIRDFYGPYVESEGDEDEAGCYTSSTRATG